VYFKIFGQNRIKKIKITRPTKFIDMQNGVKIMKKKKITRFSKKPLGLPVPLSTGF
jgi:hypothetical protein